jgi:type II secretion system protein H
MAEMPHSRCTMQAGFTMIEVMVVLVILGIIASSASQYLSFSPTRYEVEKAADAAMMQLNQLKKQALLYAQPYGAVVDDNNLAFMNYDEQQKTWLPYEFSIDNELASIIRYSIEVERSATERNNDIDIIFSGDGSYTPFELQVLSDDKSSIYTLTGDGTHAITKQ